ncbi:MAG TPA: hypothetical protein VF587_17855, partial [Solirubrobacteraceae bacterium]
APVLTDVGLSKRAFRRGRSTTLRVTSSEAAKLTIRVTRRGAQRGTIVRDVRAGANRFALRARAGGRRLRPGRYRLTVVATDAAGNVSAPRRVLMRILRRSPT